MRPGRRVFAGCLLLVGFWWLFTRRPARRWVRVGRFLPAVMCLVAGMCCVAGGGYLLWYMHRSVPGKESRVLFKGVTYRRVVFTSPRPMVMNSLRVDLSVPGVSVLVTPPSPTARGDMGAQTTREFLAASHAQVAINGNGFSPFHVSSPLDYYPHSGDPVTPTRVAASR